MSKNIRRRNILLTGTAGLAGLVIGGAAGSLLSQSVFVPSVRTVTQTHLQTHTVTISPTLNKQKLVLGEVPTISKAPLYVALEKDLFSHEGLEIELVSVPAGSGPSIEAILSGYVDISSVDYASVMKLADSRGIYMKVVHNLYAVGHYRGRVTPDDSSSRLIVGAKSGVTKLRDLIGKKIAVNALQALPHIVTSIVLRRAGIDPSKDVVFIEIPFARMLQPLATGEVDAALMIEPYASAAIKQGLGQALVDPPVLPVANIYPVALGDPVLVVAFWTSEETYVKKKPLIAGFARAIAEGVRHLYGDIEESIQILSKWFKLDKDIITSAINGAIFAPDPNGFKEAHLLETQMRALIDAGFLSKEIDLQRFTTDYTA